MAWVKAGIAVFWLLLAADVCRAEQAQPVEPPAAAALWTISSDDCVSVHADGEPWDECGFQAFAMNADGSRLLTVSAEGVVQLWDGDGRELRRLDWTDERGGASGYPSGRAAILGNTGIAIVHHNQLLLIDIADGREIVRRRFDLMTVQLRVVGGARLFAEVRDRDWAMGGREIDLATGDLSDIGEINLMRVGPSYWVTGGTPRGVVHRVGAPDLAIERSCMPVDARYCTWRDIPGHAVHVLDIPPAAGCASIMSASSTPTP